MSTAWRTAFTWFTRRFKPRERLLIVGTGPAAIQLAREIYQRRNEFGLEIVGFIDPDPLKLGAAVLNPGIIGGARTFRPSPARGASIVWL